MKLHIPCPHCQTLNRFAQSRVSEQPKCGRCKSALFDGKPITLDPKSFARFTGKSDLPVIVDFWAPWCGPCKMMAPAFAQAAEQFSSRALLAKLNTEEAPEIGARFNVRSIPTIVAFKQGREVARQSGAMNLQALNQWIEQQLL